jgi:hypothetical protein
MKQINLNVDKTGNKVTANEGGHANRGHLCANEGEKLKWHGRYAQGSGDFKVTFLDVNDGNAPDWPFVEDPDEIIDGIKILHVDAKAGVEQRTVNPGLWKYKVEYTGATSLDPMIIVRNTALVSDFLPLAVTFVLGAVAGIVGARLTRRRRSTV